MPKEHIKIALKENEIPRAARQAFRAAQLEALKSKAGVIVVSNGKLEHRKLKDGVVVTETVGDVPAPLFVGIGARKKRNQKR
ncbi:hypothetical protein [Marinagarivorans algicola]|uniref:hypothetical protein n=1 Tax=Marinagarivorans algicola TaxID=1513270 RepID=UPI0006B67769|nr:hypothetical protein [Marinagarivorans algicola]